MIRSKVFHKCDGFDKSFFAHMEEIDLCWRINNLGFEIYCEPKSKIYHLGNQTLSNKNPKKTYLNFRNNLIMILKNEHFLNLLWKLPVRIFFDFIAFFKFVINNKSISHGLSIIKAYCHFFISIRSHFLKRYKKKNNSLRLFNTVIPIKYYLLKRKKYSDL